MAQLDEKWELTRKAVGSDRLSVIMPLYRLAASAAANLRQVAELFERYGVETELVPWTTEAETVRTRFSGISS